MDQLVTFILLLASIFLEKGNLINIICVIFPSHPSNNLLSSQFHLQEHPWLQENEREKLCQAINFGKLSADACIHASQNQSLPLRAVLQVLFFEQQQLRSTLSKLNLFPDNEDNNVSSNVNEISGGFIQREGWVSVARENQYLRVDMERIQSKVKELENQFMIIKNDMGKFSR